MFGWRGHEIGQIYVTFFVLRTVTVRNRETEINVRYNQHSEKRDTRTDDNATAMLQSFIS